MKSNGVIGKEATETLKALRRAARRARELAIKTGTPVYVIKNNRIVDLSTVETRQARSRPSRKRRAA